MRMTAEQFIDLLEAADFKPASYSGRGMYGKRCVSVTVAPAAMLAIGTAVALGADVEQMDDLHDLMGRASWDNMGRDMVVYWPRLTWPDGRKEANDDDASDE